MCTETFIRFESHAVRTMVVTNEERMEFALTSLWKSMEDKRVVALGIERTFKSMPNKAIREKVAALKLACRDCCIIINLLSFTEIPSFLACFLNLPDVTFVGLGIKDSLFKLQRDYGLECMNGVDLGQLAAKDRSVEYFSSSGFAVMARCFPRISFIRSMPQNVVLRDWADSFPTADQIREETNQESSRRMRYEHHVSFCGNLIETTVTNKASIADDWVHQILSMYKGRHLVIGLGCKRRPHPITSMGGPTATLHLCVGSKCLILQLLYMDYMPKSLKGFLSNANSTFVGVEVEENLLRLWGEYGLWCAAAADVHELASRSFPLSFNGETGLKALAYQVAKLHMWKPKNGCRGDWESKLLDEQQVGQACIDSYSVYRIGVKLLNKI